MPFEEIAYFLLDIIWNAISLAKIMMFFRRHSTCQICTSQEILIFRAYIKGEYFIDLSTGLSSKTQNFLNYLSMPVLSTIVQKGGDCKSKFCPRRFWRLLDKAEVELILFSSINKYLGSKRIEFASRRSKDNSLQRSCSLLPKPLKEHDP